LDVLAELEAGGVIESALHFRLTEHGRAQLPAGHHALSSSGREASLPLA
jgi:hypothetical protein